MKNMCSLIASNRAIHEMSKVKGDWRIMNDIEYQIIGDISLLPNKFVLEIIINGVKISYFNVHHCEFRKTCIYIISDSKKEEFAYDTIETEKIKSITIDHYSKEFITIVEFNIDCRH